MDFPGSRRTLNRNPARVSILGIGVILVLVFQLGADEPYKRMLDDPLTFTVGSAGALDYLADKLVPNNQWHWNRLSSPGIPLIDVNVGTANAGAVHLD